MLDLSELNFKLPSIAASFRCYGAIAVGKGWKGVSRREGAIRVIN